MTDAEDFITKFHSLEGTLLKEKKKSLFLLLDAHKGLHNKEDILKKINENLKPKTYLEECYKLEFLFYFKRASDLFDLLKRGNDAAASKIIRQPWFLKTIFTNIEPEEFVLSIFPQLSFVVRSKILNQIVKEFKDEIFIDSLFDKLLHTYGLGPALILMPGCSVGKIKEILTTRGLALSKRQLKLLNDKDPSLTIFYYEEFHKKGGNLSNLSDFSQYLSKKNPNLFVELVLKYKFYSCRLGRQATKKYVAENKETLINNAQKYLEYRIFNEAAFVKELGNDFPRFLKAAFPQQLSNLKYSRALGLLNYYSKKKRYEIYSQIFQEIYGQSLLDTKNFKDFVTDYMIELIQSDEEREKWVDKMENASNYIKYKRSSLAIPELKEQLFRCDDIRFRQSLVKDMVITCNISKDYNALLEVLKLFCTRFRNTDGDVIYDFLNKIYEDIKLEELKDEHWNCIQEIILVQNVRNIPINAFIVFEYSRYLYKSGKSFEEMIPIFYKSRDFQLRLLKFKTKTFRDEKFHQEFLTLILKYSSNLEKIKANSWQISEIVLAIKKWNKDHPKNTIRVSEQKIIVDGIKKAVDVSWIYHASDELRSMKYLICYENNSEFTDIYFNEIDCLGNITVTKWFLKYNPKIFEEKLDKVENCMNKNKKYGLFKLLKKYEHNGLTEIITKHYLEKFKNSEEEDKDSIIQLLTTIIPRNSYLKLLEEYVPTLDKLDLVSASKEERNLLRMQSALAKSVRFTSSHVAALNILLKYCRGDYLQSTLPSLYSCFNRIPEISLKPLLESLLKKPVSVRKHTIFLAAMVFPIITNNELGNIIVSNDKNDSIKKHLFTSTYKYFLKNPLDSFWNILRKYMDQLTFQEKESLTLITNIHVIPENYRSEFTKAVCEVFENVETRENKPMNEYFDGLMQHVEDDDMRFLSSDLCIKIIDTRLFTEKYKKNDSCIDFAIKFMMYGKGDIKTNVQGVLNILQKYKKEYWNSSEWKTRRSVIYSFCLKIFHKTMNKKALRIFLPKEFTLILSEEWKKLFTIQDTFEEYLMLDFMILKHENNKDLTFYASKISKIFEDVTNVYGDLIVGLFADFLLTSLQLLLGEKNYELKLMTLLADILKENSSSACCVLVAQLIPAFQSDDQFKQNLDYVESELQNKPEIVRIYFNTNYKKRTYY